LLENENVPDLLARLADNAITSAFVLPHAAIVAEKQRYGPRSRWQQRSSARPCRRGGVRKWWTCSWRREQIGGGWTDRRRLPHRSGGGDGDEGTNGYRGEDHIAGLPTGFPELDKKIGGLKKKHLIGIGGAGKIGKTSLA